MAHRPGYRNCEEKFEKQRELRVETEIKKKCRFKWNGNWSGGCVYIEEESSGDDATVRLSSAELLLYFPKKMAARFHAKRKNGGPFFNNYRKFSFIKRSEICIAMGHIAI